MAVEIGALRALLSLDSSAFERGARRAEASMNGLQRRLSRVGQGMRTFGRNMSMRVTAPMVGAIGLAVRSSLQLVDSQAKLAESLATSVVSVQNLGRAAELTGISEQDLEGSLTRLTRRVSLAEQGMGPAVDALDRLGLSAAELNGIPVDERVSRVVAAIRDLIPEAEQAGVASQIFGDRSGLAMMRLNPEVIAQATEEVERYGVAVSEVDADQIEAANDAISAVGLSMRGLANQITVAVAPALQAVSERIADAVAWFSNLSPETRRFIAIGGALAAAIGPLAVAIGFLATGLAAIASPIGLVVIGFAALAGVAVAVAANWDEFKQNFPGVASVVETVIERISGVIDGVVEVFRGVVTGLEAVIQGDWHGVWQAAGQIFEGLFEIIDNLFGGLPGRIRDWITQGSEAIGETLRGFGRDLVDFIIEGIEQARDAVQEAIFSLFDGRGESALAPEGPLGMMRGVGRDQAQGLIDGVNDAEGDLEQAGADAVAAMEGGARDESETESPSRVWMRLGQDLMDGLGLGVADRAQAAGQAAAAAARQATDAANAEIDTAMDRAAQSAERFGSRFASFVMPVIKGTQSIGDAFANMARRIGDSFLQQGLQGLGNALFGGLFGGGGKSGGGFFDTMMRGFQGAFAVGGTLGAGQWGIAGEAGPEIVHGPARITPVMPSGVVVKNEIINNSGAEISQETSTGPDGEAINRIFVTKRGAANGDLDGLMRSRYGIRPQGVRR